MRNVVLLFFCLFVIACKKPSDKFSDCNFQPREMAFFSDTFSNVKKVNFELLETTSIEEVVFNDGLILIITEQSCEEMYQKITFDLPVLGGVDSFKNEDYNLLLANKLHFVATQNPALSDLEAWAGFVEQNANQIINGQTSAIEQSNNSTFFKIDKIKGEDNVLLTFELNSQEF